MAPGNGAAGWRLYGRGFGKPDRQQASTAQIAQAVARSQSVLARVSGSRRVNAVALR